MNPTVFGVTQQCFGVTYRISPRYGGLSTDFGVNPLLLGSRLIPYSSLGSPNSLWGHPAVFWGESICFWGPRLCFGVTYRISPRYGGLSPDFGVNPLLLGSRLIPYSSLGSPNSFWVHPAVFWGHPAVFWGESICFWGPPAVFWGPPAVFWGYL